MTQGLLLFDSSQRLVICNQRYIEMYGLSADIIKPGCSFRDVIAHRKETGSFDGDVDAVCRRACCATSAQRNAMVIDDARRTLDPGRQRTAGGRRMGGDP